MFVRITTDTYNRLHGDLLHRHVHPSSNRITPTMVYSLAFLFYIKCIVVISLSPVVFSPRVDAILTAFEPKLMNEQATFFFV